MTSLILSLAMLGLLGCTEGLGTPFWVDTDVHDSALHDTDTGGTDDTDDPPGLQWEGTLDITVGDCHAVVHETGVDVYDLPGWEQPSAVQQTATMLYLLEFDPPTACGITPPGPQLRALKWMGNKVDIWGIYLGDGEWKSQYLDEGEVVGKWEFEYGFAWSGSLEADAWAVLH